MSAATDRARSVIVSACRTPIGAFQGTLSPLAAPHLGAIVIREALSRAQVLPGEDELREVILGNVLSAGLGQAPARQAALGAGLSGRVGGLLVNKVCGSGLKAVMLADQAVRSGDARVLVAGGMESMSNAPYLLPKARGGYRLGDGTLVDALVHDGLWCSFGGYHIGATGELCARENAVTREQQDAFAVRSYERAVAASADGSFDAEIVPVEVNGTRVQRDEVPRPTTRETLAGLKPAFEEGGTLTAGNSSKLADGAAAVCVMSEDEAARRGLWPIAWIVATATHGGPPEQVMMAPEWAIRRCLDRADWKDADLYEVNEPFAAATAALIHRLRLDPERVNVHGGAIALGHPIGATGCRILVTLLHAMERRGVHRGIAALCLGGGEAVAMAVERVE